MFEHIETAETANRFSHGVITAIDRVIWIRAGGPQFASCEQAASDHNMRNAGCEVFTSYLQSSFPEKDGQPYSFYISFQIPGWALDQSRDVAAAVTAVVSSSLVSQSNPL